MEAIEKFQMADSKGRKIIDSWTIGKTRVKMATSHDKGLENTYRTSISVCKVEGIWETHRLHEDFYRLVAKIPCNRYKFADLANAHRQAMDNNQWLIDELLEANREACGVE
jgi:hypothetical protein